MFRPLVPRSLAFSPSLATPKPGTIPGVGRDGPIGLAGDGWMANRSPATGYRSCWRTVTSPSLRRT